MRSLRLSILWLLLGLAISAAVLVLAIVPGPIDGQALVSDKVLHAATFVILMVWFGGVFARRNYVWLALALLAFGGLIELAQMIVTRRVSDWLDFAADGAGIVAGVALCLLGLDAWCRWVERYLLRLKDRG